MKQTGIDGLSRGYLLGGMMAGQNPLDFIPLNESSDDRLGRVVSWITSWWKYKTGTVWGEHPLKGLAPGDWFELYTQDMPRLWIFTPAEMETVIELFNEDRLAHPHTPHLFLITRLITHLQRKQLYKNAAIFSLSMWGCPFGPDICMNLSPC